MNARHPMDTPSKNLLPCPAERLNQPGKRYGDASWLIVPKLKEDIGVRLALQTGLKEDLEEMMRFEALFEDARRSEQQAHRSKDYTESDSGSSPSLYQKTAYVARLFSEMFN